MADPLVVQILTKKHAALQGELKRAEAKSRALIKDLYHLEHVIRLYQREWEPKSVRPIRPRKPSQWRRARVGLRHALEVLKRAEGPLTSVEIALKALEIAGEPIPDKWGVWSIANSIGTSLKRRVGHGVSVTEERPKRWMMEA
jgi:hypothetical protein